MFETIGQIYGAYTLEEKTTLKELNAIGYRLSHNKTGARVVLVANDDNNKVFNIGFRTPPTDDTGIAHIMEHSVLCGSKEYPAKDPFVELVKGSLNTFLNAMTYSDKTVYPVASCNDKDFHNLMHVYLDAVFYPNIYQKPQILKQEGWHYELENPEDDITYNGVVYNEMKGVFSSAEEQLMRFIPKSLLKDTPYAFESGGDPKAITDLTQEDFLNFHKTYYHPSNSYIYLYGNTDFEDDLEFIDQHYLSNFDRISVPSTIEPCKPYTKVQKVSETYSISDTEPMTDNTYLSYNAVIGTSLNPDVYLAFQILDYVLLSSPGAPLKMALIDAGIGKDVFGSYDNGVLQPTYSIIAKNANNEDEAKFIHTIEEELNTIAKQGIDSRSLQAAINYFEFKYKEANFGRYPKGLMYGLQMFDSWLYDDTKPFIHVTTEATFERLKEKMDQGYFEGLIEEYLLHNTHKSIITLSPKKGLNAIEEARVKDNLKAFKESLTTEEINAIIADTKGLKAYQDEPSLKEDLDKIPMLTIDDIGKEATPIYNKELDIEGIKVVHHDIFTNGIAYVNLSFDMKELSPLDISWASLLTCLYEFIDTKNYTYKELSNEINIETGGVFTNVTVLPIKDGQYISRMEVKSKVLFSKIHQVFDLAQEIILTTKLEDKKRLKEIIAETKSRIQNQLSAQGHSVSANRAMSYISKTAYAKDLTAGIGFYEFLTDLDANFEEKADEIVNKLVEVSKSIFQKNNLMISYTADNEALKVLKDPLNKFAASLYSNVAVKDHKELKPVLANEGFKTASQVQYVATAGNFMEHGYAYTGALKALQVIFSYDYLWINIRVKGGAYGCMSGFSRFGDSYFTSYRDPNLMETYEVYQHAWEFIKEFDCDDRDMTKYIIGAVSNLDVPLEPSASGSYSFSSYLMGITMEDLQREREELLAAKVENIRNLADLVKSVTHGDVICAIGSEVKLEENKENFKKLLSIF